MVSARFCHVIRRGSGGDTPDCGCRPAGHVHQGRRADPSALLRHVPSHRRNRADVADDLRRGAAVGARDQDARRRRARCRRGTSTRRSASRTFKDDPSLTDEEIATIAKWVDAGAPRGNPADMPPPRAVRRARRRWQIGEPDLDHQVPDVQGARGRSGPLRRSAAPTSRSTRIATSRRSRRARRRRSRTRSCTTRCRTRCRSPKTAPSPRTAGSSSSSTPRARTPRCTRRARACCCKSGQKARVSYHLHSIGEEIDGGDRARHQALSEGLRAEAHPLVAAARAADDAARHPGRHGRAQRRLHDPPQAGAAHRVPAAHAQPRQAPVSRADLPDVGHAHDDRDDQLRELQQQLAPHLQLHRRCAAARAGRHDPSQHPVARQHDGQPARDRSEELGRRRPADDRRDGLLLDRLGRADRRGIQDAARGAQREAAQATANVGQQQQQQ